MTRGLLVDDDALYLRTLQRALERRGMEVATATDAAAAVDAAHTMQPDFALVDLKIGHENGLDLIAPLWRACATTKIVLVTGYASAATAVEAIKRGADDDLAKPASDAAILARAARRCRGADLDAIGMTPLRRLEWSTSSRR